MDRVKTGITGFDDLIADGIPRGSTIVISGPPGAGKTCLAVSFLINGITKFGEPGIFCSFNESKSELIRNQLSFGHNLEKYIEDGSLILMDYSYVRPLGSGQILISPTGLKMDLPGLVKKIKEKIDESSASRLVIDPLTIISLIFDDPRESRYNMLRFFDMIRRFRITTFAITEKATEDYSTEEYLSHAVIRLYNTRIGTKRQRGIEIIKMRGVAHKRGIYPYNITDKGIYISSSIEML